LLAKGFAGLSSNLETGNYSGDQERGGTVINHLTYYDLTASGNLCFYAQDLDGDMWFAVLDVCGKFTDKWAPLAVAIYSPDWKLR
jgi:hypothetical protein